MQISKLKSDVGNQRKSLNELGLVLPFAVWLGLFLAYMCSAAVLYFVPNNESPLLRGIALAVSMFIMGIFCAFKAPLWVSRLS